MDVTYLHQAGPIIIYSGTDTSMGDTSSWDSEDDPCLGLEGSDLSDYLRHRADLDAIDAAYTQSTAPTLFASSSHASSSVDH